MSFSIAQISVKHKMMVFDNQLYNLFLLLYISKEEWSWGIFEVELIGGKVGFYILVLTQMMSRNLGCYRIKITIIQ